MPALPYRAKPMTKGFTTEGGMRFAFPPYALFADNLVSLALRVTMNLRGITATKIRENRSGMLGYHEWSEARLKKRAERRKQLSNQG